MSTQPKIRNRNFISRMSTYIRDIREFFVDQYIQLSFQKTYVYIEITNWNIKSSLHIPYPIQPESFNTSKKINKSYRPDEEVRIVNMMTDYILDAYYEYVYVAGKIEKVPNHVLAKLLNMSPGMCTTVTHKIKRKFCELYYEHILDDSIKKILQNSKNSTLAKETYMDQLYQAIQQEIWSYNTIKKN